MNSLVCGERWAHGSEPPLSTGPGALFPCPAAVCPAENTAGQGQLRRRLVRRLACPAGLPDRQKPSISFVIHMLGRLVLLVLCCSAEALMAARGSVSVQTVRPAAAVRVAPVMQFGKKKLTPTEVGCGFAVVVQGWPGPPCEFLAAHSVSWTPFPCRAPSRSETRGQGVLAWRVALR